VDQLFLGKRATMFANHQKYVIHEVNKLCDSKVSVPDNESSIKEQIENFLSTSYPKNKHLHLMFNIFSKHDLINEELFFKALPNIHIADFCSFINNRFDKQEKVNKDMLKLCKYLQAKSIRFPKVAIKNPVAQKLLTY